MLHEKTDKNMTFRHLVIASLAIIVAHSSLLPVAAMQQWEEAYMPGRVTVEFKEGALPVVGQAKTGLSSFDKAAAPYGVHNVQQAFPIMEAAAAKRELSTVGRQLRRMYTVEFTGPYDPWEVANALMRSQVVEQAEPHFMYHLGGEVPKAGLPSVGVEMQSTPNDTRYDSQTHLKRLEMEGAWDVVKAEDGDIVIAVVDGGTEWRHRDLRDNVWVNADEIPGNGVDDDENGFVDDVNGWNFSTDSPDPTGSPDQPNASLHGTAVAGIAAAETNNGLGIAGTSWNAKFMPVHAGCPDFEQLCYARAGTLYAVENGANVITASYGSPESSFTIAVILAHAVERGAVVVAAAGNTADNLDTTPFYPASYPTTLSVGGIQKDSDRTANHAFGRSIDVVAASVDVDFTTPGSGFDMGDGTSYAVPLVAGVAALVQTQYPEFGPFEVMEQLKQTADDVDAANSSFLAGLNGKGRLNARRAVTEVATPGIRLMDYEWTGSDGGADLRSGDVFTVEAEFANFGGEASALMVGLSTPQARPFVTVRSPMVAVGPVQRLGTFSASFELEVSDPAPENMLVQFLVTVQDGDFTSTSDLFRIRINIKGVHQLTTKRLITSITDEGNIGYKDTAMNNRLGSGFVITSKTGDGSDILYEGGLMIGTSAESVIDCVRSEMDLQNDHFVLAPNTELTDVSGEAPTTGAVRVELRDDKAPVLLGLNVLQESFVDDTDGNDEFLLLKYTVTNVNATEHIDGMWVGLFLDWDIAIDTRDRGTYNEEHQVGMIFDQDEAIGGVGVKVLTNNARFSYEAIDNTAITSQSTGGYTAAEKWESLSGGIGETEYSDIDLGQVIGAGPFNLKPQESAVATIALIAGQNESVILENAANAQRLWDEVLNVNQVAAEENAVPAHFNFAPVYPNPSNGSYSFSFTLPHAADVDIVIFNALSQEVRALIQEPRNAGEHTIEWDGMDDSGARVASGVYFARLNATDLRGRMTESQPLVVVR